MRFESPFEPGEENLTPDERLRIHTARQAITPEKAPTWWEHWVANLRSAASLLNEEGKVWRSSHKLRFEDVFLILWVVVFAIAAIWLVVITR